MKPFLAFLAALLGLTATMPPADARPPHHREQDQAFRARQEGRIMPLRAIEAMIVPRMRGFDYLGPELDGSGTRYRLKFLRAGEVVWIDVDARTGRILGQSGR